MRNLRLSLFYIATLVTFAGQLWGQVAINPQDNSPYSRLGIGDLVNQQLASSRGIGSLTAAVHDPYHINLGNPASYAYLPATAFEVGFNSEYARLDNQQESVENWSGNLDYLAIAFPLINPINKALDRRGNDFGLGMSFALVPYSRVGYDIQTQLVQPNVDTTVNNYLGAGGTYRVMWGNGFRYKTVSGGINLGYLFGKISNQRQVVFNNLEDAYSNIFIDDVSLNGLIWDGGLQYDFVFKKLNNKTQEKEPTGKVVTLGVFGSSSSNFSTNSSQFYARTRRYGTNVETDTLTSTVDVEGTGILPGHFGFGIQYQDANNIRLGAEYQMSGWSKYETNLNEGAPIAANNLADTWRFGVGMEWIPDHISYNNYFKRVRYRLGGYYQKDPRTFNAVQLTEYALTLGAGFPIVLPRQQTSFANVALEVGQFGLSEGLKETFVKLTLGVTLNDNTWFFKRKFN